MEIFEVTSFDLILLITVGSLFLIQLIFWFALYNRIHDRYKAVWRNNVSFSDDLPPLSVVICSKNESASLREFLPLVLNQNYPNYEVVVVNDGSTDETEELLSLLETEYPHLYHSFTPEKSRNISHKKLALTLGIKASKHDWLVFTEANCYPVDENWLRLMARNFTADTDVVLGYSGYERGKGWKQKNIAFDTLFGAMRYLGFAIAGKPYMGIGRNMAYRKALFFEHKGYSKHLDLERGDDDLFINAIANSHNTRVEVDANAVVRMKPNEYINDWREEKISYLATSSRFKGIQRFVLGFETCTKVLFHFGVLTLIILGVMLQHWLLSGVGLLVFLLRFGAQLLIVNRTAKSLDEPRRYYFSLLIFDVIQPFQAFAFKCIRLFRGKHGDVTRNYS